MLRGDNIGWVSLCKDRRIFSTRRFFPTHSRAAEPVAPISRGPAMIGVVQVIQLTISLRGSPDNGSLTRKLFLQLDPEPG